MRTPHPEELTPELFTNFYRNFIGEEKMYAEWHDLLPSAKWDEIYTFMRGDHSPGFFETKKKLYEFLVPRLEQGLLIGDRKLSGHFFANKLIRLKYYYELKDPVTGEYYVSCQVDRFQADGDVVKPPVYPGVGPVNPAGTKRDMYPRPSDSIEQRREKQRLTDLKAKIDKARQQGVLENMFDRHLADQIWKGFESRNDLDEKKKATLFQKFRSEVITKIRTEMDFDVIRGKNYVTRYFDWIDQTNEVVDERMHSRRGLRTGARCGIIIGEGLVNNLTYDDLALVMLEEAQHWPYATDGSLRPSKDRYEGFDMKGHGVPVFGNPDPNCKLYILTIEHTEECQNILDRIALKEKNDYYSSRSGVSFATDNE